LNCSRRLLSSGPRTPAPASGKRHDPPEAFTALPARQAGGEAPRPRQHRDTQLADGLAFGDAFPSEQEKLIKLNTLLANLVIFHNALDIMDVVRPVADQRYHVDPPVECYVRLALWAAPAGRFDTALQHVAEADRLVTRTVAWLSDFEHVVTVEAVRAEDLREARRRLPGGEPAPGSFALLRTMKELWRDPARRMSGGEVIFADDSALEDFAARMGSGRVGVLEQVGNQVLLTIVEAGQQPQATALT
jgi:hypothetical protein